eukprot:6188282-Pleurochrysis_carterae.AAC.2
MLVCLCPRTLAPAKTAGTRRLSTSTLFERTEPSPTYLGTPVRGHRAPQPRISSRLSPLNHSQCEGGIVTSHGQLHLQTDSRSQPIGYNGSTCQRRRRSTTTTFSHATAMIYAISQMMNVRRVSRAIPARSST